MTSTTGTTVAHRVPIHHHRAELEEDEDVHFLRGTEGTAYPHEEDYHLNNNNSDRHRHHHHHNGFNHGHSDALYTHSVRWNSNSGSIPRERGRETPKSKRKKKGKGRGSLWWSAKRSRYLFALLVLLGLGTMTWLLRWWLLGRGEGQGDTQQWLYRVQSVLSVEEEWEEKEEEEEGGAVQASLSTGTGPWASGPRERAFHNGSPPIPLLRGGYQVVTSLRQECPSLRGDDFYLQQEDVFVVLHSLRRGGARLPMVLMLPVVDFVPNGPDQNRLILPLKALRSDIPHGQQFSHDLLQGNPLEDSPDSGQVVLQTNETQPWVATHLVILEESLFPVDANSAGSIVLRRCSAESPAESVDSPSPLEDAAALIDTTSREHLLSNECCGKSSWGMDFCFFRPATEKYPSHQWLWDESMHMVAWSHMDVGRATRSLRTLLSMQRPDGRVPQIIRWIPERVVAPRPTLGVVAAILVCVALLLMLKHLSDLMRSKRKSEAAQFAVPAAMLSSPQQVEDREWDTESSAWGPRTALAIRVNPRKHPSNPHFEPQGTSSFWHRFCCCCCCFCCRRLRKGGGEGSPSSRWREFRVRIRRCWTALCRHIQSTALAVGAILLLLGTTCFLMRSIIPPDPTFSDQRVSDLTQTPLLPWSLQRIVEALQQQPLSASENTPSAVLARKREAHAAIREFVPLLIAYFEWWAHTRDPDGDGLVSILHPWESGLDASPMYDVFHATLQSRRSSLPSISADQPEDWLSMMAQQGWASPLKKHIYPHFGELIQMYSGPAYQWDQKKILAGEGADLPFNFQDVGVNAVYAAGWAVLRDLLDMLPSGDLLSTPEGGVLLYPVRGTAGTLREHCHRRYRTALDAIQSKMWSSQRQRFVSLVVVPEAAFPPETSPSSASGGQHRVLVSAVEGVQTLFPLLLRDLDPTIVHSLVYSQLLNPEKFWTRFPVNSVSADASSYAPLFRDNLMWRGPSWPILNWIATEGLMVHGFQNEARQLVLRWMEMVMRAGIWEQYNPETGAGYGPRGLGMSTSIVDAMRRVMVVPEWGMKEEEEQVSTSGDPNHK